MPVVVQKGAWRLESSFGLFLREGSVPKKSAGEGPQQFFQIFENGTARLKADIALVPTEADSSAEIYDFHGDWLDDSQRTGDWALSGTTGAEGRLGFRLNDDDVMEGDETFDVLVFAKPGGLGAGETPVLRATVTIRDDDVNGSELADLLRGSALDDHLRGYGGNDTLRAGLGHDALLGGGGDDLLWGDGGNDTLDGGAGSNSLQGGGGDDTYVVSTPRDRVSEAADAGTDLVLSAISHTLGAHVEGVTLTGTALKAVGNGAANSLTGNAHANTLDGRQGNDTMAGGAGNDTYIVDHAGDIIRETAAGGIDLVRSGVSHRLAAHVENLTLTGAADVNATGNGLANILTGNAGNNVLNGGTGADRMTGGAGNDIYVVDNAGDALRETAGGGRDGVRSSISHALAAHVEDLALTGAAAIGGKGNGLDNALTGNGAANRLTGGAGMDSLSGGGGRDVLDGGGGRDLLAGGAGADLFVFRQLSETRAGAGRDTIRDFSQVQDDAISLRDIDANMQAAGNQGFRFIGTADFSEMAGQLRYGTSAGQTVLRGDVNGDGLSDFAITLAGLHRLTGDDFLL